MTDWLDQLSLLLHAPTSGLVTLPVTGINTSISLSVELGLCYLIVCACARVCLCEGEFVCNVHKGIEVFGSISI